MRLVLRRVSAEGPPALLRSGSFASLRTWATAAIVLLPQVAHACPVCFGAPNTPASNGMNNAIAFLLTIVGFVQIGFVALFVTFWRRGRALRRRREELQLIDGGVR